MSLDMGLVLERGAQFGKNIRVCPWGSLYIKGWAIWMNVPSLSSNILISEVLNQHGRIGVPCESSVEGNTIPADKGLDPMDAVPRRGLVLVTFELSYD